MKRQRMVLLTLGCLSLGLIRVEAQTKQTQSKEPATVELSATEVVARRTRQTPSGSLVVSMIGNPIAKGKNLMEVLRFIRGVKVSGQEAISINGKEDAPLIYLGDRQISSQELRSIPPEMIKTIEVIPFADISHQDRAKGGIIKITLRQTEGLFGNIALRNQDDRRGYVDGSVSSTLHYPRGKLTLHNRLSGGEGHYYTRTSRHEEYAHRQVDKEEIRRTHHTVFGDNLGLTYQFSDKQSLEVYGGVIWSPTETVKETFEGSVQRLGLSSQTKNWGWSAGGIYKIALPIGKKSLFQIRADYSNNRDTDKQDYLIGGESQTELRRRTQKLLIEPKIEIQTEGGHLYRMGLMYGAMVDNNQMEAVNNPLLSQLRRRDFVFEGPEYRLWGDYRKFFAEKLYLSIGGLYQISVLRNQDYLSPEESYRKVYRVFSPKVSLRYYLGAQRTSSLSADYKYFYSYPNYGYYSPVPHYQTDQYYSVGNQALVPELYHQIELGYTINTQWKVDYRLRHGSRMIHLMTHQDGQNPNLFFSRPENVGNQWRHYLSLSYTHSPLRWWQTNNSVYLKYQTDEMPHRGVSNLSLGWDLV